MPLAREALVTVAEAREHLGVSATDDPSDPQLELLINGVSRRIVQRTGRTYVGFSDTDAASARKYLHDGSKVLGIEDAREVTSVETSLDPDDASGWTPMDAANYVLEPVNGPTTQRIRFLNVLPGLRTGWAGLTGGYSRAAAPAGIETPWPREVAGASDFRVWVRVNAKWGYGPDTDTVPGHVKLAALLWVANIHKREQAYFSEDLSRAVAEMGMPPDVEELLTEEGTSSAQVAAV